MLVGEESKPDHPVHRPLRVMSLSTAVLSCSQTAPCTVVASRRWRSSLGYSLFVGSMAMPCQHLRWPSHAVLESNARGALGRSGNARRSAAGETRAHRVSEVVCPAVISYSADQRLAVCRDSRAGRGRSAGERAPWLGGPKWELPEAGARRTRRALERGDCRRLSPGRAGVGGWGWGD